MKHLLILYHRRTGFKKVTKGMPKVTSGRSFLMARTRSGVSFAEPVDCIIIAAMKDEIQARAPYRVSDPRYSVSPQMVTTAFDVPGFRVVQNLGVVRGIVVRSRSIVANIGASLQTLVGGNITAWTNLCEQTRADAFDIMIQHASEMGANAIIGARYDATEIAAGAAEVLAYGTAVIVEPLEGSETIYDS